MISINDISRRISTRTAILSERGLGARDIGEERATAAFQAYEAAGPDESPIDTAYRAAGFEQRHRTNPHYPELSGLVWVDPQSA